MAKGEIKNKASFLDLLVGVIFVLTVIVVVLLLSSFFQNAILKYMLIALGAFLAIVLTSKIEAKVISYVNIVANVLLLSGLHYIIFLYKSSFTDIGCSYGCSLVVYAAMIAVIISGILLVPNLLKTFKNLMPRVISISLIAIIILNAIRWTYS